MSISSLNKYTNAILALIFCFAFSTHSFGLEKKTNRLIYCGATTGMINFGSTFIITEISADVSINEHIKAGINTNLIFETFNTAFKIGPTIILQPKTKKYIPFIEFNYLIGKENIKVKYGEVHFGNYSSYGNEMFEKILVGTGMFFMGFKCNYWDSRISFVTKYGFGLNQYQKPSINDSYEFFNHGKISKTLLMGILFQF